jgi:hypothetical protein
MSEIKEVKQLAFDANKVEQLRKDLLNRELKPLTFHEMVGIVQFLQGGAPIESESK